jgi:L-fuculose-phosphate aldolase
LEGKVISGKGKPSSETLMHLAVYNARPEINAVIHAHPPITTALTVAGVSLAQCIIPEVVITMGSIPLAEYATPCTADGARVVKDLIHETDAIILDRHGSLTIGETLQAAFFKLEKLEHAAHVTATAKTLGNVKILPKEEVQKLIELRHKLGIKSKTNPCSTCSNCKPEKPADIDENALVNLVTEEILKKFAKQK